MKKFTSILSLLLTFVLALSLSACTIGGGKRDDDIGELTEHKGKITVWWPGSTVEKQAIEQAKADYIAQYPDVQIDIIGQSTADFYTAYMLAVSGNTAPDIAYVDHVFVQSLAYSGHIANLSSAGMDALADKFVPSVWNAGFYENKLYGLPMSSNILVTAYNKTLIARAQNTTADAIRLPKNYEEMLTLSQQIVALNSQPGADKNDPYYALTIPAGTTHESMATMSYLAYVNRSGGTGILSADMHTSLLNTEACITAAKRIFALGQYAPQTFSEAKFESGKIGFIEMGPWKIEDYARYSANYNWEVGYTTALPFTAGGNAGGTLGLYDLVVTNNKNAALAADFAKFLATDDAYQLAFAKPQNLIPTTKTALADPFYSGDVWQTFIRQLDQAVVRPGSPVWSDIENAIGDFVSGLVSRASITTEAQVEQECHGVHSLIQDALDDIYA